METAKFVLTPFYECMDAIIPLTQLRMTNNIPDLKPGRFIGNQMIEFSLRFDHSFLLSESKKHKSNKFDIRAIIRFCNAENVNKIDDQFSLKDNFPIHLKLNLNNTPISLPQFLPNDRSGKDGRRFPRPIDLSEGLLDNPLVINKFLIQWVQDEGKKETFYFAVYLVRRRTCEELTCILLKKQLSHIKNTLNFILEQSNNLSSGQDEDLMLVNTTINTSLLCPVSRVRMTTPVRGQHCTHLQCFDCITYLIMNFNKPTWQCPVCDKKTFFCYLEVDSLLLGIINDDRSKSLSGVIFNKNGQWKSDKKLPGSVNDDEAYNDITGYAQMNDDSDKFQSNFHSKPENLTELHTEKYLQQILQYVDKSSLINRPRAPNNVNAMFSGLPNSHALYRMPLNNPTFQDSPIRPAFNVGVNPLQSNPVHPTSYQDNLRHLSTVASTMNLNQNQQDMHLRMKLAAKPADFSQTSFANNNGRNNQVNSQKLKRFFSNDIGSQIKITNVTSIAKNARNTGVIVISDDENDDTPSSSVKYSAVKMHSRAQKRPTTVSSVPSNADSVKFQRLSDNGSGQMPMRAYASSAPSILDTRMECSCTSNNMCPPHREMLLRNRIPIEKRHVISESNHLKSQDVVDLTHSNIQMDNFQKQARLNQSLLEQQQQQRTMKLHPQIPELIRIDPNRNTVKEFLKTLQNQPDKINLNQSPFTIQHRPTDPNCPMPPDYFQQQWMQMMMSSSQPYSIAQNLPFPQSHNLQSYNQNSNHHNNNHNHHHHHSNNNNTVDPQSINSLINQSKAFYNC